MEAKQQSLLNVQNNLANVIKNIESNLFKRNQKLENNVLTSNSQSALDYRLLGERLGLSVATPTVKALSDAIGKEILVGAARDGLVRIGLLRKTDGSAYTEDEITKRNNSWLNTADYLNGVWGEGNYHVDTPFESGMTSFYLVDVFASADGYEQASFDVIGKEPYQTRNYIPQPVDKTVEQLWVTRNTGFVENYTTAPFPVSDTNVAKIAQTLADNSLAPSIEAATDALNDWFANTSPSAAYFYDSAHFEGMYITVVNPDTGATQRFDRDNNPPDGVYYVENNPNNTIVATLVAFLSSGVRF